MNKPKPFNYLSGVFLLISTILVSACEKTNYEPTDIFTDEELGVRQYLVELQGIVGADQIIVNEDRIIETNYGYHIKGTIFTISYSGILPITSGDFKIVDDNAGNTQSFRGYGIPSFPKVGLFLEIEREFISGGLFNYQTGRYIKSLDDNANLPLEDKKYYFCFDLDNSERGQQPQVAIKNTSILFNNLYVDSSDPIFYIHGNLDYKKPGNKAYSLRNLDVGVSANGLIEFESPAYDESILEAISEEPFSTFRGSLYLSGEIPMKKYPVKLIGEAVINTTASSKGAFDFFENGFYDASFQLGANGRTILNHQLLSFIPGNIEIEVENATLEANYSENYTSIRVTGEYDQPGLIEKLLGENATKHIPFIANEGRLYVSIGNEPADWKFYIETAMKLHLPDLGETELQHAMIFISPESVKIYG